MALPIRRRWTHPRLDLLQPPPFQRLLSPRTLSQDATLAYKAEALQLQRQLRHLHSQFDMLTEQASTLIQGRWARVAATSTVNGHLTTIDDSLSARNLQMNAVLGRMASTAQELAGPLSFWGWGWHPFSLLRLSSIFNWRFILYLGAKSVVCQAIRQVLLSLRTEISPVLLQLTFQKSIKTSCQAASFYF